MWCIKTCGILDCANHNFLFSFKRVKEGGIAKFLFIGSLWKPVFMLYCHPIMYWALLQYLLKEVFKI
jgi:hypothetical protein